MSNNNYQYKNMDYGN